MPLWTTATAIAMAMAMAMSRRILFLMGVPQAHADTPTHTHTRPHELTCSGECLKRRVEHARYTFSRRCGFTILIKSYTRTTSAKGTRPQLSGPVLPARGFTLALALASRGLKITIEKQRTTTTAATKATTTRSARAIYRAASIFNIYLTFQSTLKRPLSAAFMHMRIIY